MCSKQKKLNIKDYMNLSSNGFWKGFANYVSVYSEMMMFVLFHIQNDIFPHPIVLTIISLDAYRQGLPI